VLDERSSVVWRDELPEAEEPRAQRFGPEARALYVALGGDNQRKIVYQHGALKPQITSALRVYSRQGHLLWQWRPTAVLTTSDGRIWQPPYLIEAPDVRQGRTFVASNHYYGAPALLSVLNGKGHLIGSYGHYGHLDFHVWWDFDSDGREELILGGLDDLPGRDCAEILVFRPDHISGSAAFRDGRLAFEGLGPSSAVASAWFPRSRVSRGEEFNRVAGLQLAGRSLRVIVAERDSVSAPQ
jgi:hypothetical protein